MSIENPQHDQITNPGIAGRCVAAALLLFLTLNVADHLAVADEDVIEEAPVSGREIAQGAPKNGEKSSPAPKKTEVVTAKAYLSVDRFPAGDECEILIYLTIKEGWHINANPAQPDNFIPTTVKLKSKQNCTLDDIKYPEPIEFSFPGLKEPLHVYEGKVAIRGVISVPVTSAGQVDEIELHIRYQSCNDKSCLPPKTLVLKSKVQVAGIGQKVTPENEDLFRAEDEKAESGMKAK
ncbi:MAG: protein-disulfide reductase DsbD domain-containing protein [Planctomycetaceae bacterium]